MSSVICFNLEESKILSSGKGLTMQNKTRMFLRMVGKNGAWKMLLNWNKLLLSHTKHSVPFKKHILLGVILLTKHLFYFS